jgi:tetratricopeptide (TPR) repeat protein
LWLVAAVGGGAFESAVLPSRRGRCPACKCRHARTHARTHARATHKQGRLREAVDDYTAALRLEPRRADALYHRGALREKLGALDDAIRDFTAVLAVDPNHVKAGYARAACRNLKGEFFEAIGAFGVVSCVVEVAR